MIANKKSERTKISPAPVEEPPTRNVDDFDTKRKMIREKMKAKRVSYVVKDLPIY